MEFIDYYKVLELDKSAQKRYKKGIPQTRPKIPSRSQSERHCGAKEISADQ